jgi:hypothetical protein
MTAWFLVFFTIHSTFMTAGPYNTRDACERDLILVSTFQQGGPYTHAPNCIERPAGLSPQALEWWGAKQG